MIALEFGDNTDDDTWAAVFDRLIGWTIAVNDVDMQLTSLWSTVNGEHRYGLYGYEWDDEAGEGNPDRPVAFDWDQVTKVHIY